MYVIRNNKDQFLAWHQCNDNGRPGYFWTSLQELAALYRDVPQFNIWPHKFVFENEDVAMEIAEKSLNGEGQVVEMSHTEIVGSLKTSHATFDELVDVYVRTRYPSVRVLAVDFSCPDSEEERESFFSFLEEKGIRVPEDHQCFGVLFVEISGDLFEELNQTYGFPMRMYVDGICANEGV